MRTNQTNNMWTKFVDDDNDSLDGVWSVMNEHPSYLQSFLQTHNTLLNGDGPLPAADRHFLAVTACARHSCVYLIQNHKTKLLAAGGEQKLISNGLSSASKKMQKLYELNKILAHRPWTLTAEHIVDIVQMGGGHDANLSLSELVYAVVLMAHFHAFSSFVQSCVVMEHQKVDSPATNSPEPQNLDSLTGAMSESQKVDSTNGTKPERQKKDSPTRNTPDRQKGPSLVKTKSSPVEIRPYNCGQVNNSNSDSAKARRESVVRRRPSTSTVTCPPFDCSGRRSSDTPDLKVVTLVETMEKLHNQDEDEMPSKEELIQRYRMEQHLSADLTSALASENVTAVEPDISQFIVDPDFQYIDFAKRTSKSVDDYHEKFSGPKYGTNRKSADIQYPTFRIQDYSWDEEGFSLMNRFYGDISEALDDKFRIISNLTYQTMGNYTAVDTSLFRSAVWNYIQCLVGIRHDDYDYAQVNKLLHKSLKKYIKTASCYPEHCAKEDYQAIMKDFKESEKIHVMLLVSEAKFQSEILYALKAISSYFTKS